MTSLKQISTSRIRSGGRFTKAPNFGLSGAVTRVMLVEDDSLMGEAIALLLEAFGYTVCASFGSGEDAVAEVSSYAPDIILMDIHLEGILDGFEAAELIAVTCSAPVIFMTATSDPTARKRASGVSNSGFLMKPFYPEALTLMIESILRDFSMAKEAK